jgi:hypothetical protein
MSVEMLLKDAWTRKQMYDSFMAWSMIDVVILKQKYINKKLLLTIVWILVG